MEIEIIKILNKSTYIVIADIGSTSIKDTFIGGIYIIATWIRYAGIKGTYTRDICTRSALVRDIEPKALIRLRIILIS